MIIPLYANVTKRYKPTATEVDWFYDMNYDMVAQLLTRLSRHGYDYCLFGGESESIVLFNDIQLVHAITGREM